MAEFCISSIKQPFNMLEHVQQIEARVCYTAKSGRKIYGSIAGCIVYKEWPVTQTFINARIETTKDIMVDEIERKIGVRSGLKGNRGYFIFQSYELVDL